MSANRMSPTDGTYVFGHADAEIRRLLLQAHLHDDFTEHALRLAGLRPGMRVLVRRRKGFIRDMASRLRTVDSRFAVASLALTT